MMIAKKEAAPLSREEAIVTKKAVLVGRKAVKEVSNVSERSLQKPTNCKQTLVAPKI